MATKPNTLELRNRAMARKLDARQCIDVSGCERTVDGDYILAAYVDGVDYCDAKAEAWIWSIGKNVNTGDIVASTSSRYYQQPGWECLWLR